MFILGQRKEHCVISQGYVFAQQNCNVNLVSRATCGVGDENQCLSRGCCYDGGVPNGFPKCYLQAQDVPKYLEWGQWGSCSKTCGTDGVQTRTRDCQYSDGRFAPQNICETSLKSRSTGTQGCNRQPCQGAGSTTVAPGGSSTDSGECTDSVSSCTRFGRFCGLGSVKNICKKTCNACDGASGQPVSTTTTTSAPTTTPYATKYPLSQCVDELPTCNRVLDICGDSTYRAELTLYCRKTCNLCPSSSTSCTDKTPQICSRFKSFCNQEAFQRNCQKTCNVCDKVFPTVDPLPSNNIIVDVLTTTIPVVPTTTRSPFNPFPNVVPTTTTTSPINPVPSGNCQDAMNNCANIVNVCSTSAYIPYCRLTCNACGQPRFPNVAPNPVRPVNPLPPVIPVNPLPSVIPVNPLPSVRPVNPLPSGVCEDKLSSCSSITNVCTTSAYIPYCRLTCNACEQPSSVITTATLAPVQGKSIQSPSQPIGPIINIQSTNPPATTTTVPSVTTSATTTSASPTSDNSAISEDCKDKNKVQCSRIRKDFCLFSRRLNVTCPERCEACVNGKNPYVSLSPRPPVTVGPPPTRRTTPVPTECKDLLLRCANWKNDDPTFCSKPLSQRVCRKFCNHCSDDSERSSNGR